MDFKEYIVQRIEEMPLVTLAMGGKDGQSASILQKWMRRCTMEF